MNKCQNCGTENPDESKFCSSCGTKLETPKPLQFNDNVIAGDVDMSTQTKPLQFNDNVIAGDVDMSTHTNIVNNYNSTAIDQSGTIEKWLKRITMFIADGYYKEADEYCEKVLDIDPENTKAYIFKTLARLQITKEEDLVFSNIPLENMISYKNALRFADEDTAKRLMEYNRVVKEKIAKRERERQEREQKEEADRQEQAQEQARIERERRQQEEKKRQKINTLQSARDDAANLISAQTKEQYRLKGLIAKRQSEAQTAVSQNKLRTLSIFVLLLAAIFYIFLFALAITMTAEIESSGMQVFFILSFLLLMIFSGILFKANEMSVWLVLISYFTIGIFTVVIAVSALIKNPNNKTPLYEYEKEIKALNAQLKQVEAQIDISKHSLSEINQNLETYIALQENSKT